MRKRIKVLLLVGCLAAVCALTIRLGRDDEPYYQGRSLTDWLLLYGSTQVSRPDQAQQALTAVRAIGTNALPCLLEWVRYAPSPGWYKTRASLEKLPPAFTENPLATALLQHKARTRFVLTSWGFEALGAQAAPAVPELTQMLNTTSKPLLAHQATLCLAAMGPEGLPPIAAALANPQYPFRTTAVNSLSTIQQASGTNVASLLPLLAQCAVDKNPRLAEAAIRALGRLALEPDLSLPPMIRALGSTNQSTRLAAARAFTKFGAQAHPAVPALQAALNDPDLLVNSAAREALLVIAPTALTNTPAQ